MRTTLLSLIIGTTLLAPAAQAKLDDATAQAIQAAMQHEKRDANNKARDIYRKPMEVLDFLGFKQDMTVVEMWPAGGWYTEVLAPALKDHGQYYAAHYSLNPSRSYQRRYLGQFLQMVSDTKRFGDVKVTTFELPDALEVAPAGSADMVLTFRNVHNWMGSSHNDLAFKAMFAALKPGGTLGVVDHQWDNPAEPNPGNGYITTQSVIDAATAAGFEFVAESQVLDNPKDTKDYAKGVWTLPPSLTLGDKDKDKYLAIGESDRFVLKFKKPQ